MATLVRVEADRNSDLKLLEDWRHAGACGLPAPGSHRLRRTMTREQGRALETLGHAVEIVSAGYLHNGADDEILDFRGPELEAARILIAAQRELLGSLPLREPLALRLWHALLQRKTPLNSARVVPLSSSR